MNQQQQQSAKKTIRRDKFKLFIGPKVQVKEKANKQTKNGLQKYSLINIKAHVYKGTKN